jgi:hypothetical protein
MSDPNIVLWDEIDVVSPLRQKTIEEYQRRNPPALEWSEDKLKRLIIRTETRWARTLVDESVFVVNSSGRAWEGNINQAPPDTRTAAGPMGEKDRIHVNLYALMRPSEEDQGFADQTPFCSVSLTRDQVRRLPIKERDGQPIQVQLADFLADRLPNRAACIRELNTLIAAHKQLALSRRAAQAAKQSDKASEVEVNGSSQSRSNVQG